MAWRVECYMMRLDIYRERIHRERIMYFLRIDNSPRSPVKGEGGDC